VGAGAVAQCRMAINRGACPSLMVCGSEPGAHGWPACAGTELAFKRLSQASDRCRFCTSQSKSLAQCYADQHVQHVSCLLVDVAYLDNLSLPMVFNGTVPYVSHSQTVPDALCMLAGMCFLLPTGSHQLTVYSQAQAGCCCLTFECWRDFCCSSSPAGDGRMVMMEWQQPLLLVVITWLDMTSSAG
jgi:hypothetical protein